MLPHTRTHTNEPPDRPTGFASAASSPQRTISLATNRACKSLIHWKWIRQGALASCTTKHFALQLQLELSRASSRGKATRESLPERSNGLMNECKRIVVALATLGCRLDVTWNRSNIYVKFKRRLATGSTLSVSASLTQQRASERAIENSCIGPTCFAIHRSRGGGGVAALLSSRFVRLQWKFDLKRERAG